MHYSMHLIRNFPDFCKRLLFRSKLCAWFLKRAHDARDPTGETPKLCFLAPTWTENFVNFACETLACATRTLAFTSSLVLLDLFLLVLNRNTTRGCGRAVVTRRNFRLAQTANHHQWCESASSSRTLACTASSLR